MAYLDNDGLSYLWGKIKAALAKKQDPLITSGATVGQTPVIKAVDADGKPTQWEAKDDPTTDVVHKTGDESISGVKTFVAPEKISGINQTTTKFNTSNGGAVIIGKEGANNGTMLRFDQVDGTTRLQFRASAAPGAMIWEQPEHGAQLYIDLGAHGTGGDYHRISFPSSYGVLALQSDVNDKVPKSRKINGHALSSNIDLTAADVSAIPSTLTGTAGQVLTKTANGQEWKDAAKELPTVTTADNGKFLRVVNGAWTASSISDANGVSF